MEPLCLRVYPHVAAISQEKRDFLEHPDIKELSKVRLLALKLIPLSFLGGISDTVLGTILTPVACAHPYLLQNTLSALGASKCILAAPLANILQIIDPLNVNENNIPTLSCIVSTNLTTFIKEQLASENVLRKQVVSRAAIVLQVIANLAIKILELAIGIILGFAAIFTLGKCDKINSWALALLQAGTSNLTTLQIGFITLIKPDVCLSYQDVQTCKKNPIPKI